MTVKQIIARLEELPQDVELRAAYEGDIKTFEIINIEQEEDGEIVLEYRED